MKAQIVAFCSLLFGLAGPPALAATLSVRQPDDTTRPMQVQPSQVKVLGKSDDEATWVCVAVAGVGKMWALPSAWMAEVPIATTRVAIDQGRVTGGGNGFGGIAEAEKLSGC